MNTRGAGEGTDDDPFPDLETDGVFAPRTYAGEVLRLLTERLEAAGLATTRPPRGEKVNGNATPSPSLNTSRRTISAFSSIGSSFGGFRGGGRTTSTASENDAEVSISRTSSAANSIFTDSDASDGELDEFSAVDGLASALGREYMGYHPTCRWNLEVTARRKNAAMERDESENAEMERTLQNLWRAWIGKYDADKSGTVSLAELKAFASATVCPSSDSYMQTLHEWASNALELGDLDAEFNRVDVDGSGELEYPEFRAMLLTE